MRDAGRFWGIGGLRGTGSPRPRTTPLRASPQPNPRIKSPKITNRQSTNLHCLKPGSYHPNRRRQSLSRRPRHLNLPHDVHPAHDAAERRKPLTVGIAGAPEIERWLIADADEELAAPSIFSCTRHRHGAVLVREARDAGALERDRRRSTTRTRASCVPRETRKDQQQQHWCLHASQR